MVIEDSNEVAAAAAAAAAQSHPSGIAQDKIDNIMSGISNTGAVKLNNHRKKLRQRFDIIKKLGQGTYGKVQLGINKETGQEVAIKTIKKCKIEAEADLVRIRREVQIMSSVQHPNIIHIYEVFENREKMVLVMEFAAGGELYDYLSERKVLAEEEARRVFRQVSTAVYYCHKHKICHRDLKLENILLDENGNAKIADFGLSNVFDDQRLLATFCGSPLYASPEIVKGTPYQGPEVDCWSLGVLLYTLVYGSMPFDGSNFKRLVKQISQGDYYEPKKPSRASPLIRDMLTVCPEKRADIEQICRHWWVNEGYEESCLELAEALANQTPVRLDVLLSLSPIAVTADQLVVPSGETVKSNDRVSRSHSVGSIRCMINTAAEKRILDMVAAGGEEALMPSPTRIITPIQSPQQIKRKMEEQILTESNAEIAKKKERPTDDLDVERMDVEIADDMKCSEEKTDLKLAASLKDLAPVISETTKLESNNSIAKINDNNEIAGDQISDTNNPTTKVLKKIVSKHKTADMISAINKLNTDNKPAVFTYSQVPSTTRKNSLLDDFNKMTEPNRSRIMETAEKFQNNNQNDNQTTKYVPGMNVSNVKKKFERKSSLPAVTTDRKMSEPNETIEKFTVISSPKNSFNDIATKDFVSDIPKSTPQKKVNSAGSNESFSLEEARRSMENSIALLNQARDESLRSVDMLCEKTGNIAVSNANTERERKLQNAREIIGNAIQPGVRRFSPFTQKTHEYSPTINNSYNSRVKPFEQFTPFSDRRPNREQMMSTPFKRTPPIVDNNTGNVKTSKAEITLKSATLPRRKVSKAEIKLEIEPKITEHPITFSTEMQHKMPDIQSAPIEEVRSKANPLLFHQRATSLGPADNFMTAHKPPMYMRQQFSPFKISSNINQQQSPQYEATVKPPQSTSFVSSQQPIKKSPREFIIPIAVEGGGFVTPKPASFESSGSSIASASTGFSKIRQPRLVSSLFTEPESEDNPVIQKLHGTPITEVDENEPRFSFHRLRSSRPLKKNSQECDSQSSGEEEDDDGFEILTAENLFSTLLQRVRALTNRLNVNNEIKPGFPNSSRLLNNMRKTPFWNDEPFERRINESMGAPWRRSLSRDLENDFDTMFSRTGATLPRGNKKSKNSLKKTNKSNSNCNNLISKGQEQPCDLADLDLSRLQLSKKDFDTLSCITPGLPKCFQEQLIAKLPANHARKLSRTLSMQNNIKESSPIPSGNGGFKTCQSKSRDFCDSANCNGIRNLSPVKSNKIHQESDEYNDYENFNRMKNLLKSSPSSKYQYSTKPQSSTAQRKQINGSSNNENDKELENILSNIHKETMSTSHRRPPSGYLSPPPSFTNLSTNKSATIKSSGSSRKDLSIDASAFDREKLLKLRNNPKEIHKNSKLSKSVEIDRHSKLFDPAADYQRFDENISNRNKTSDKKHLNRNETNSENINESVIVSKIKNKNTENLKNYNADGRKIPAVKESSIPKENIAESKSISHIEILQIMEDVKKNKESKLRRPKSYPNKTPKTYTIMKMPVENSEQMTTDSDQNYNLLLHHQDYVENNYETMPKQKSSIKTTGNVTNEMKINNYQMYDENSLKLQQNSNSKIELSDKKKSPKNKVIANNIEAANTTKPSTTSSSATEKKSGKGLLFAIGKKLDKFIENSKNSNKKKSLENSSTSDTSSSQSKNSIEQNNFNSGINYKESTPVVTFCGKNLKKNENLSKIDKELIDNYVTENFNRAPTESGLLKKAVSAGEIPNSFDKCGVRKVLAFFKKFEKDSKPQQQKVLSTRSTSNITDSNINMNFNKKNKIINDNTTFKNVNTITGDLKASRISKVKIYENSDIPIYSNHNAFNKTQKNHDDKPTGENLKISNHSNSGNNSVNQKSTKISQKSNKLNQNLSDNISTYLINIDRLRNYDNLNHLNGNEFDGDARKLHSDNYHIHDCNRNQSNSLRNSKYSDYEISLRNSQASLSNDNSSSSVSTILPHDCDDSELNFENLSICSAEDNHHGAVVMDNDSSPYLSRLSRQSNLSTGSTNFDNQPNETMMDRIKRRSFYCRFNANKPKRQSNIVGAAARDYYRENEAKLRSRPRERISSLCTLNYRPEIEYLRQSKMSTSATENDFKNSQINHDHSKSAMPPSSASSTPSSSSSILMKSHQNLHHRNDNMTILRNRGQHHNIYNTYDRYIHPNHSYILNDFIPPLCSNNAIDGYSTLGRRSLRSYDHRTSSMFDYGSHNSSGNSRTASSSTKRQGRTPSLDAR